MDRMNIVRKGLRSGILAEKVIYAALSILRDNGKQMPISEFMSKIEQQVEFDEWEKSGIGKSGCVSRWKLSLEFFSEDCTKAGFLKIKEDIWHITHEGEEALKMSPEKLLNKIIWAYNRWKEKQQAEVSDFDNHEL
jgi:restriction system protein